MPLVLNAAKVGVLHLKAVGVDDAMAEAVADLLVNDLTNYGYNVLNPEAMDAAAGEVLQCYESQSAADAGLKAQVERVIYGSVSKLGEKHMLQVAVVNVSTRDVVWSGSAAAKTAEDLDVVVKRVAKAIHEGKKIEAGAEVGMITEQEITQETKRKEAFFATGGNFYYGLPVHGYGGASGMMGMNWMNWYETPAFAIELKAGYAWSLGLGVYDTISSEPVILDYGGDISFLFMFSKSDFSPYIGGGMGIRFLAIEAGWYTSGANFGLCFNAGGGMALFRTYDFHLMIDARYVINTANIPNYQGPHGSFNISMGMVYRPQKKSGGGCGGCGGGGCF
jgi:hypothetical protein